VGRPAGECPGDCPRSLGENPPRTIRRRSNNNRYETGRPQHVGKPTLAELQTKLDGVRREVRNLTVMEMDPKQPPDQVALIRDLEQSAQVEMRLRSMALKYAKGEPCSHRQQRDKNAARD
ncbi:MAG: hypothetical protein WCE32_09610, partial [Pseudolabrys sp.]